jgi:hypothetical protein
MAYRLGELDDRLAAPVLPGQGGDGSPRGLARKYVSEDCQLDELPPGVVLDRIGDVAEAKPEQDFDRLAIGSGLHRIGVFAIANRNLLVRLFFALLDQQKLWSLLNLDTLLSLVRDRSRGAHCRFRLGERRRIRCFVAEGGARNALRRRLGSLARAEGG